jgi:uncharacterized protein
VRRRIAALALLALVGCGSGGQEAGPEGTPLYSPDVVNVKVGDKQIVAEVASDRNLDQIETGLMHRTELDHDRGMLFLLPGIRNGGFHMTNTLIPLTIAYLEHLGEAKFEIVGIVDMDPCPRGMSVRECPRYPTPGKLYYGAALEMNRDWFKEEGIEVGDRLEVLNRVE